MPKFRLMPQCDRERWMRESQARLREKQKPEPEPEPITEAEREMDRRRMPWPAWYFKEPLRRLSLWDSIFDTGIGCGRCRRIPPKEPAA